MRKAISLVTTPTSEEELDMVNGLPLEEGEVHRRATTLLAALDISSKDKVKRAPYPCPNAKDLLHPL